MSPQAQPVRRVEVMSSAGISRLYPTLEAALDSLRSGETLRIAGRHVVQPAMGGGELAPSTAPLRLRALTDVTLEGVADAEIHGLGAGDFLSMESCARLTVKGLTFSGNRPAAGLVPNGLYAMIQLRGTNSHIRIERCRFVEFGNHGISHLWGAKQSSHVTITGCVFERGGAEDVPGLGFDGAAVSGIGSHWILDRNHVIDCVRGFEIENVGTNRVEAVSILNNSLVGIRDLGLMLFATQGDGTLFSDILVSGNVFRDFVYLPGSATAMRFGAGTRIQIKNNTVRNMARQGIALVSADGDLSGVSVSGNSIDQVGNNGIVIARGTGSAINVMVQGNMVSRCGESGIRLIDVQDASVSGNQCYNNGLLSEAGGIEVRGARSHGVMVNGNRCYDTQDPMTQDYGVWVLAEPSTTWVQGNFCADAQAAVTGIRLQSPLAEAEGNKTTVAASPAVGNETPNQLSRPTRSTLLQPIRSDGSEGTSFTIVWPTVPGRYYTLQFKIDLADPSWADVFPPAKATTDEMTHEVTIGDRSRRFYRVLESGD